MTEPKLKELPGAARLTKGFFNGLIRRIECTKPLAGSGIAIEEKPDGMLISVSGGGSGGMPEGFSAVTVNVCSGGVQTQLLILAKPV